MDDGSLDLRYKTCLATLRERNQEHVLRWWDDLTTGERSQLLQDIESIPWDTVDPLCHSSPSPQSDTPQPGELSPPNVHPRHPTRDLERLYVEAAELGRQIIRDGKVAAFTVAGGQGTRLGFEGPKGAVTVSPVREKTLFQLFAEMIRTVRTRYEVGVPWYIMTNPANHEQTVGFLKDHDYFGIPESDIVLFSQAMLPTFDFQGRMLLEDKHRLALAPDGHGGSLKALVQCGALDDLKARGIEVISYFQVDNPLVKPFDPLFIGLHAKTESEMSTKVASKTHDRERVGNVCVRNGSVVVIEYSNFPENLAREVNSDGSRKFDVGNLAIHLLDVSFLDRIISQRFELPYHRAKKTVTCMDEKGFLRTPGKPNAVKLETFVFDAIPHARNPLLLEVDRAEEFSPVKNAKGEDSVETAVRHQIYRAVRWLEAAGVEIPRKPDGEPDITIEIAAAYALEAEDVKRHVSSSLTLRDAETIYLS